jgi:periplasmic protein TonB
MRRASVPIFVLLILGVSAVAQVKVGRARISENVMQGLLIKKVDPQPSADAAQISGEVVLKAWIDKGGNIEQLELINGQPKLVVAVIEAVKQWKYKPYLINGEAVKVETTIRVTFPAKGASPSSQKEK